MHIGSVRTHTRFNARKHHAHRHLKEEGDRDEHEQHSSREVIFFAQIEDQDLSHKGHCIGLKQMNKDRSLALQLHLAIDVEKIIEHQKSRDNHQKLAHIDIARQHPFILTEQGCPEAQIPGDHIGACDNQSIQKCQQIIIITSVFVH